LTSMVLEGTLSLTFEGGEAMWALELRLRSCFVVDLLCNTLLEPLMNRVTLREGTLVLVIEDEEEL
jgi:hypothetical protein